MESRDHFPVILLKLIFFLIEKNESLFRIIYWCFIFIIDIILNIR